MKAVRIDLLCDILCNYLCVAFLYRADFIILICTGEICYKDFLAVLLIQLLLHCSLVAVGNIGGGSRLCAAAGGHGQNHE